MSANTSIEWTATVHPDGSVTSGKTWNPVRGCSVISPGCTNCYAMKQAHRFSGVGKAYEGLTKQTKAGPQWTGVVRTAESALLEPLKWRKPCRVFVNSMSDLFHEDVPDKFIQSVFTVMAIAKRHTFQILTKRPMRMLDVVAAWRADDMYDYWYSFDDGAREVDAWPLPNVWLGVSVENQHFADERIPLLLQTPAAVRFISAEPLLGPINLREMACWDDFHVDALDTPEASRALKWVIVGGESGPKARPCALDWIRSLVAQCQAAGVPVFVKQMGTNPIGDVTREDVTEHPVFGPEVIRYDEPVTLRNRKGGDPAEWPADLRVREYPDGEQGRRW